MKLVAILGGGPAGAFAAERLASSGVRTVLIDEKLAWEKPCGGGLTYKAYNQYPFLIENDTPKRIVKKTMLSAPKVGAIQMSLDRPLVIYSRLELNRMLLTRAQRAGAQIERARVLQLSRNGSVWRVRTKTCAIEADYCILATGARNSLREVGTQLRPADAMRALGYYVPTAQEHVDIQFLAGLEGYIWVFPRCGHLSVGICGKGESAHSLRARLEAYMREKDIPLKDASFYSHVLPSLERPAWQTNRVAGEGWAAVGDAGGLVDPITGEGLYYAIRSADLASQIVLADEHAPAAAERAQAYRNSLRRDFTADLEFGASLAKRLFVQKFLFSTMPACMIHFMRRSPRFAGIVQDLFAGTQPYLDLKGRLLGSLNGTMHEIAMSFFLGQFLTGAARAESSGS